MFVFCILGRLSVRSLKIKHTTVPSNNSKLQITVTGCQSMKYFWGKNVDEAQDNYTLLNCKHWLMECCQLQEFGCSIVT